MMLFEASTGRRGPHEFTHNLVAKMEELMIKAQPGTKWYRTDKQLGCCRPDGEQVSKKTRKLHVILTRQTLPANRHVGKFL